jgi:hypothetical protein
MVDGAVSSTVFTSSGAITNGVTDVGFLVRVTRSSAGLWTLYTSTLPTANGEGAIATDIPNSSNASINQGSATHNTFVPSNNQYFGIGALHTSTADPRSTVEFDQFYFTANYDYTISTTAGQLIITDIGGNSETLTISENGANIRFDVTARNFSLNNGLAAPFPVDIPLAGITSIVVNTAAGNDIINVSAFIAALPSLTINGGTGDDAVNFNGDITFAANANLDVDLQNDDATPGTDRFVLATNANLVLSGTGAATVRVSRNAVFNSGSGIETENGDLIVEANQQAIATSGGYVGVDVNGGTLEVSGTGTLTVLGKGGNSSQRWRDFRWYYQYHSNHYRNRRNFRWYRKFWNKHF